MALRLEVNVAAWRARQARVLAETPGLVPVVKGNGYGFGLARLGAEASRLGVDSVAVGEPAEVAVVAAAFGGDVLVMAPCRPEGATFPGLGAGAGDRLWGNATAADRVVRTVSHLDALRALAASGTRPRVVVELLTSMRRHGVTRDELSTAAALLAGVRCDGVALHLPLAGRASVREARELLSAAAAAGLPTAVAWVSHLTHAQVRELEKSRPGTRVRLRCGTRLWLGDRSAFHPRATVLDVRPLPRGTRYGYRQRRARSDGHLLVLSGGTAHGVGLDAPKAVRGVVPRARTTAIAALALGNRWLSPFIVAGRQRWFAEPPHMQVSLVLLPAAVAPPAIGDEVDVDLRMTTAIFDQVDDE